MKKQKREEYLDRCQEILDEPDRYKRWRMAADLAREINSKVKREQDKQAKAMEKVRKLKLYNQGPKGKAGLKFSLSIPNMTWRLMVAVDPELSNIDKKAEANKYKDPRKDATNELVRKMVEVFPEYRVNEDD